MNYSNIVVYLYCSVPVDTYDQAASNIVSAHNLEQTIQQIIDIGGGNWDKETVTRALRAAYNNPERAVDYLYMVLPNPKIFNLIFCCHLVINNFPSKFRVFQKQQKLLFQWLVSL